MDFSPSLPSIPRLRIARHSQLSPLDDDLSRTPTAGPSRLHVLQDESEDTDATPRLTVSSSLPSVYAVTEDTPAARLRALLAQVPNTSSASRTQLLHEPPPSLPSDRESDFEPPPRWAYSSTNSSSARESLRSLFTHALRDPGDTPRKDVRRNSIDLSEVEDTPRSGRVMEERARNKGKRMSFSDEELDKSSREFGIRSPVLLVLTICPHQKERLRPRPRHPMPPTCKR
jgi:serine/arginine repetitive matrix protein 2